jgi:hypothetical protein
MTRRGRRVGFGTALVLLLRTLPAPAVDFVRQSASREAALRVVQALDRIEAEAASGRTGGTARATITEAELNAFLAYRIEEEGSPILRELALHLFAENRVEGKAFIDLSGAKLSFGLEPRFNLYFEARLLVENGYGRLDFQKLFIEGQAMPLLLLEMMIAAASSLGQKDAASLREWVELPYGLRGVKTEPGRVILVY